MATTTKANETMTIELTLNWKPYYDTVIYAENKFGIFSIEKNGDKYTSFFAENGDMNKLGIIGDSRSVDESKALCLDFSKRVIENKLK